MNYISNFVGSLSAFLKAIGLQPLYEAFESLPWPVRILMALAFAFSVVIAYRIARLFVRITWALVKKTVMVFVSILKAIFVKKQSQQAQGE